MHSVDHDPLDQSISLKGSIVMKHVAPLSVTVLLLGLLTGCGGSGAPIVTPPPPPPPKQSALPAGAAFLYVGDSVGMIHGLGIDPSSGNPIDMSGSPYAVTNQAAAADVGLAADAGGHVLYATSAGLGGPNVASFLVDQTSGALSVTSQLSLPVPVRKLAAASGGGSTGSGCCVYVIPDPRANAAELFVFTIDKFTAALTEVTPSVALPCVPHDLAVAPSGSWIGITCDGASGGEIVSFTRDAATGALGTPAELPTGGNSPQGIVVTPDGSFVVLANQATSNISVFSLDSSTGGLTAVSGSPFASGNQPGPVAIDPSGKFIFVGNTGGNSLSAYGIDSMGSLTPLSGTPITLGTNAQPSSIAVDHAGKFVFVSIVPQQAAGFALESNTGALTSVTGSPFSIGVVTRDLVFVP
jgi:6-phosphogluconolactonase